MRFLSQLRLEEGPGEGEFEGCWSREGALWETALYSALVAQLCPSSGAPVAWARSRVEHVETLLPPAEDWEGMALNLAGWKCPGGEVPGGSSAQPDRGGLVPHGWGPCSWLLPCTSTLQHSLLERTSYQPCLPLTARGFPTPSQPHGGCRRWNPGPPLSSGAPTSEQMWGLSPTGTVSSQAWIILVDHFSRDRRIPKLPKQ